MSGITVVVVDGRLDEALRTLKKKFMNTGAYREVQNHLTYAKPSEKRRRKQRTARIRRRRAVWRAAWRNSTREKGRP